LSAEQSLSSADLTPLQRAALAIKELKAKLESSKMARNEPIAVVGTACRFPGASDVEEFWKLLTESRDCISEVPAERWSLEQWFDANPTAAGKINTRYGGFIKDVDLFDAGFFGIPAREAALMDPGQRLLLELVWESLERSCIPAEQLKGSKTGFFVGMGQNDYGNMQIYGSNPEDISAYSGTGNGMCFASGRISYQFGFHGPALTSDTACSSSMVALYQAVQSLRSGSCDTALAAGVQLNLTPPVQVFFSRTQSFSPDGRCFTFDERANGFVLGEGVGVVVLKRLSDARRSGLPVLAVIREAGVNHGGAASALTVPNEAAQEMLLKDTLSRAGVDPSTVSFVETHGTGTNLGDPIEVGALRSAYGNRPENQPLLLGSVKTNIGHLNAAAGIAGFIKTVLMLQHRQIVPNLHFQKANNRIPWDDFPVGVPTEFKPWLRYSEDVPLRAGVSSFGLSGTNGHLIMEEAPDIQSTQTQIPVRQLERNWFTLTARTKQALIRLAERHLNRLVAVSSDEITDYCYTAAAGRSHLEHRISVIFKTKNELIDALKAVLSEQPSPLVRNNVIKKNSAKPRLLLLLTDKNPVEAALRLLNEVPFAEIQLKQLSEVLGHQIDTDYFSQAPRDEAHFVANMLLGQFWEGLGCVPSGIQAIGKASWAASVLAGAVDVKTAYERLVTGGEPPDLGRPRINLYGSGGDRLLVMHSVDKEFSEVQGYDSVLRPCRLNSGDFYAQLLAELQVHYLSGVSINWKALYEGTGRKWISLPVYPFESVRHWIDTGSSKSPETSAVSPVPDTGPVVLNKLNNEVVKPFAAEPTESNLAQIMDMQLRLTAETLQSVTEKQFDYLRSLYRSTPAVSNQAGFSETLQEPRVKSKSAPKSSIEKSTRGEIHENNIVPNQIPENTNEIPVMDNHSEMVQTEPDQNSKKTPTTINIQKMSEVIYLFPGVGDHYVGMGKGLYDREPVYREAIDYCFNYVQKLEGLDLKEIIFPPEAIKTADEKPAPKFDFKAMLGRGATTDPVQERMNKTRYSQPLVFITEYALGRLWQSRGVVPDAMIGYSIGEYAAAVLSGVMALDDALTLITRRASLIETIENGALLAVPMSEQELSKHLSKDLHIAIISTPTQCVVGGPEEQIDTLKTTLEGLEIISRKLQSTHAFHTQMLKPLHAQLVDMVSEFRLSKPKIPFVSNLTGNWIRPEEATDASYWARHTWQCVRFADGMSRLLTETLPGSSDFNGNRVFLEVGPGVSLGSFMLQHPDSRKLTSRVSLPSLRTMYEKTSDEQFLQKSIGRLELAGISVLTHKQHIIS